MKLFVLLSRVPYPIEKGDKLRAFHQIRCLSVKHEIILCALSEGKLHPGALTILKKYCKEVHVIPIGKAGMLWNLLKTFFNGKPMQTGYFYRRTAKSKILSLINKSKPDHIYCQLLRVAGYVSEVPVPKTLDYQDVFSIGMKRRMETSSRWMKPLLNFEYKRLSRYENLVFGLFDHTTIISSPDRDLIGHPKRQEIAIVPNGVDHQYFAPLDCPKTYELVFTGNMGYPPNINAAEFLTKEIFPLVRKEFPSARLLIAGANPHARVLALQSDFTTVSGWIPDIRESYACSKIFIAPMQIGTGLQNKLLEAMSMKIPCITSRLANTALGARETEEILVGTSAGDYAGHILHLLNNRAEADKMAQRGYEFVRNTYDWEKSTAILENLMFSKPV